MSGTDSLTTKAVHNSCYGDGVLAINNDLKVGCYGEGDGCCDNLSRLLWRYVTVAMEICHCCYGD